MDAENRACLKGSIKSEHQKDIRCHKGVASLAEMSTCWFSVDQDNMSYRKCTISAMTASQDVGILPHLLILCQINKLFSMMGFSIAVWGDTVGGVM